MMAFAKVAQLVELTTENRAVGGSSPPLGTKHRWRIEYMALTPADYRRGFFMCLQDRPKWTL